jgi:TatD DNase family protein
MMSSVCHLIDSHVHLDLLDDPVKALKEANRAGVERFLAVGIDIESSQKAVEYAQTHSGVNASVGIHPHDALLLGAKEAAQLRKLAGLDGVVAIGETGLDYYRDRSPRSDQKKAFITQIELARETGRTLVVHSRDAAEETLEILDSKAQGITVVLHCFAMHEYVKDCTGAGYYMSVAGNVTYKNADRLRQAVSAIPASLLLTETDSPYLSPVPHRGSSNSPKNISYIADALALLLGVATDVLIQQIEENYLTAFRIPR